MMSKTVVSAFAHRPASIGGMETYARELSVQLEKLGWKSVLVFMAPPPQGVREFLELPNVSIEIIEDCGQLSRRPIARMMQLLVRHRPRIVHYHFIDARSGYPWLSKLLLAKGVYLTDHISRSVGYGRKQRAAWRTAASRLLHWPVDKIFCVSDFVRHCQAEDGVMAPRRLVRLYNAVDRNRAEQGRMRRQQFRRQYDIADDETLVVQVSWLIAEKGVADLLHAARLVANKNDKVRFLIVGEGDSRSEFERMACDLGIADRVIFAGRISDPLGAGLYAASDIVCQLSRWEEAFGFTISEAMASGKPVIATRVGGIPELIRDGENGYLVPRGDGDAVADRILMLAEDSHLRDSMGEAGYEICRTKFDLATNVAALLGHFGLVPSKAEAGMAENPLFKSLNPKGIS